MTDMAVVHERALRSRGEVPTARHRGGDLPGAIAASALPTRHRSATEPMPGCDGALSWRMKSRGEIPRARSQRGLHFTVINVL